MSRRGRKIGFGAVAILLGAISFWLPIDMIELRARNEPGMIVGIAAPFLTELIAYLLVARVWKKESPSLALCMCLGLYVLGPAFAEIGYGVIGGGFVKLGGWWHIAKFVALFSVPPLGLEVAGPQAIPMLLSTATMFWFYFKLERKHLPNPKLAAGTGAL